MINQAGVVAYPDEDNISLGCYTSVRGSQSPDEV